MVKYVDVLAARLLSVRGEAEDGGEHVSHHHHHPGHPKKFRRIHFSVGHLHTFPGGSAIRNAEPQCRRRFCCGWKRPSSFQARWTVTVLDLPAVLAFVAGDLERATRWARIVESLEHAARIVRSYDTGVTLRQLHYRLVRRWTGRLLLGFVDGPCDAVRRLRHLEHPHSRERWPVG